MFVFIVHLGPTRNFGLRALRGLGIQGQSWGSREAPEVCVTRRSPEALKPLGQDKEGVGLIGLRVFFGFRVIVIGFMGFLGFRVWGDQVCSIGFPSIALVHYAPQPYSPKSNSCIVQIMTYIM